MIKIAICDDEPMMAQELASHLAEYMKEKSITAYDLSSFPDSCALLDAADRFDVIFLDIQMAWRRPGCCASGEITACWSL